MPNIHGLEACVDLTPLILNSETLITRRNQIKKLSCKLISLNKVADQIKCYTNIKELRIEEFQNESEVELDFSIYKSLKSFYISNLKENDLANIQLKFASRID